MGRLENHAQAVQQNCRAQVERCQATGERNEEVGRDPTTLGVLCHA